MTVERLTAKDTRLIVIVILAAIASVLYTRYNFLDAFPEASIDLRYSKDEIAERAEKFLREQSLSTTGFRNITLFDPDDQARIYLERELGLAEANRLMATQVAVWRWRARWFRPPEREEMVVYLTPGGDLAGFEHVVAEAEPGARLEKDAARKIAEDFLAQRTKAPHRLIEEKLEERPARFDYHFTWEQEDFRARDATYRRTVVIQGDRIGRYSEYLHVPEQWRRDFATLRSRNELYAQIAQAFYLPLVLAAVVILIRWFRRRLIHWRPLLLIAGVVAALMVITQWNSLPFFIDQMPTSSPYRETLIFGILQGLGAGMGTFFFVILAAAAGEPLYRRTQPDHVSLLAAPSRKGIRTKEFFIATVVGYGFAAAHIAFVVAFYLIGRRFGVWSPQDVNYSDFLSTRLPWIYPLTISLLASTSEEFWFRLFAIPFLKRFLRSTWLAVLIPAFIWGFLHANYPQQPAYIRGIEVGVIGVAAGWLMLRYGILATLIWHYVVDAVFIGMFLTRAESLYFQISGWLVGGAVLFPLLVSLAFYWRHGGFLAEPELLNSAVTVEPPPAPVAIPETRLDPIEPKWPLKWLLAGAVVAAAIALLVPYPRFGDFIRLKLSRSQAEAAALLELKNHNQDASAWRSVTQFIPNLGTEEFEYIRRQADWKTANEVVRERTQTGLWRTRYFRPLEKEEWHIFVDQEGRAFRHDHLLDENAPGANLAGEEARRLAADYLGQHQKVPLDRYRLVDSQSEKRERRTDHSFVWENEDFRIGEARARVSVSVLGEEPTRFRRFLKLPEEWLREFRRPRLSSIVIPGALGAVGILLLIVFVRRLSERRAETVSGHRYHWRIYSGVAATGALAAIVGELNRWPVLMAGYDTSEPFESYIVRLVLSRLASVAFIGFGLFLIALAADVFLQLATGDRRIRPPSLMRAAAVFVVVWGALRVAAAVGLWVPGPKYSLPLWNAQGADTLAAGVAVLSQALVGSIWMLGLLTIAVCAAARYPARRRLILLGLTALVVAVSRGHSAPQFVYTFGITLAVIGVVVAVVRICAVDLITFWAAMFWFQVAGPAMSLVEQPAQTFRWNGIAALVVAAGIGMIVVRRIGRERLTVTGSAG